MVRPSRGHESRASAARRSAQSNSERAYRAPQPRPGAEAHDDRRGGGARRTRQAPAANPSAARQQDATGVRSAPLPRQRLAGAEPALPTEVRSHRRPLRRFQVAGTFILVLGSVAGSYAVFDKDKSTQQRAPITAEVASVLPFDDLSQQMAQARAEAKAKAEAAAAAEAERVAKANEVAQKQAAAAKTPTPNVPSSCNEYTGNRALGCAILLEVGFGLDQMPCLDQMWTHESNWRTDSYNTSSGAGGIPQALPENKMATFGADYLTNPVVQIRWGLDYIKKRYGSPCQAWTFWQAHHYY